MICRPTLKPAHQLLHALIGLKGIGRVGCQLIEEVFRESTKDARIPRDLLGRMSEAWEPGLIVGAGL
jgi:hypothetical protein